MELNEILGEELYQQVQEKLGDKKLILNDGSYIPKTKFNEVNESKKSLITELETLKGQHKDNLELTKQIEELQKKEKELQDSYTKREKELSIKFRASKEGALDEEDILKFVDLNNENIDEQFKTLKEKKPYLFKSKEQIKEEPINEDGFNPSNNPIKKTSMDKLQGEYNEAIKKGNTALAVAIQNKMFKK